MICDKYITGCGHLNLFEITTNKRQKGAHIRELRRINGFPTRKFSVKVQCCLCGHTNSTNSTVIGGFHVPY